MARTHYFLGRGGPSDAAPGRGRQDERPKPPRPDRRGPPAPPPPEDAGPLPPEETGPPPDDAGPPGSDRARRDNEEHLRQAIQILEHLIEEHPSAADYRHLLACCYRDLPVTPPEPSQKPTFDSADKAIEILRQLVADFPDVPDYRLDLSKTYAKLHLRDGRFTAERETVIEDRLRQSLKISEKLIAENPHVPEYTAAHVHSLYTLTEVLRHARRPDEAETTLRKALAVQSSLAAQFPQAHAYLVCKTILQESLAKMLANRGRTQEVRFSPTLPASRAS